jgi:L-fuconolactonase
MAGPPPIVDAHVHYWDTARRHHAWLDHEPDLRRPFGPADLDAGGWDVAGVVAVQADCREDEGLDEARWLASLAVDGPVLGVVAHAPLERGAAAADSLDALRQVPGVVGVRRLLQDEPTALVTDPAFVAGVRSLAPLGLTFDVCVREHQLTAVAALAAAAPEVRFVLDHLGKPDLERGDIARWRAAIADLARRPNVTCKLSGLATEAGASRRWEAKALPCLAHALDAFGPARCLFGSDWPVLTLRSAYARWIEVVLSALEDLGDDDRRAVLAANAVAIYGLDSGGTPAGAAMTRIARHGS